MSGVYLEKIIICGILPYFLERENSWFEKNFNKILEASKSQAFFQENVIYLEKDKKILLSELLRKLDELGYEKVWRVNDLGEFAHLGGTVDVFPINLNFAVRIEFLGNKIESIKKLPLEIESETEAKGILKKKLKSQKLFSDLKGIKPGDFLVHLDHGIGKFLGLVSFSYSGRETKYYEIEYQNKDKLFVPVGLERKLSRYIGFTEPQIAKLGTLSWAKTKRKIKEEAEKFAKELLEIYAQKEIVTRPPYLPEDEIDKYLEETFPFEETPDQIKAIEEIKKDLESEKPMDRLLCGDVGFGKTEIALRAMVKVVKSGYQTALLCPTTILANQHYQNIKNRLRNLPIRVALLSRLQTKKEQKKIVENIKNGQIDIVVGTHRLFSKDLEDWLMVDKKQKTKGLGLLVIDDEHKFGVNQKEKFRKLRSRLDILSLSATPIPRTLYMALTSLKSISLIQTPPAGRMPIKTFVLPFKEEIVKKAIENELKRGGQIFYLHNKIQTIEKIKNFLESLKTGARFAIVHGRMKEKELIKVMEDFQNKKTDVLVATTIIEAGIDLPNVNTLIVADATKLGLSQAYQIKGRVGRSHVQGFAYFLYPARVPPLAQKRLKALKEAEELGSGYKIALRDLEIRGAGNILGKEQSGNINKVGLNLYCQMISEAIEKLKRKR